MKELPYEILTLAQKFSPTGKEQQGFTNMYNELYRDGLSDDEIINHLLHAILDGRLYGNWPSS